MSVSSKGLLAVSAALVFGVAACNSDTTYVPETKAYCLTGQPGKNPIQIIARDGSGVIREGGPKYFKVDENALTCAYTEKTGETLVYNMFPAVK